MVNTSSSGSSYNDKMMKYIYIKIKTDDRQFILSFLFYYYISLSFLYNIYLVPLLFNNITIIITTSLYT